MGFSKARLAHGMDARQNEMDAERNMTDIWDRVRRRLRAELGEDIYSSWFSRIELVACDGSVAQLSVPTKFLKSWIQAHYLDRLVQRFSDEIPGFSRVQLHVRTTDMSGGKSPARILPVVTELPVRHTGADKGNGVDRHADGAASAENGLPANNLDRRMTFATFFTGRSNALAKAAAEKVADRGEATPLYNPLYVHAGVGLGKTHLIQAVAHAVSVQGKRVIYLSADGFMYGFVAALKSHNALAFKDKLRGIDLLVIDDIQFLQGKSIQQEFCHTLNALLDAGKQVVIAADRAP
ncbi:MAG: DnaA ATPase domain-containing protein, partial [Beijerinckiaceae bacterium]